MATQVVMARRAKRDLMPARVVQPERVPRVLTTNRQLLKYFVTNPTMVDYIGGPLNERRHYAILRFDLATGGFVFFPDETTLQIVGNQALFDRTHTHDNQLSYAILKPLIKQITWSMGRAEMARVTTAFVTAAPPYAICAAAPRTKIGYYDPYTGEVIPTTVVVSSDDITSRVVIPSPVCDGISRLVREYKTISGISPYLDPDELQELIAENVAFKPFRDEIARQIEAALRAAGIYPTIK